MCTAECFHVLTGGTAGDGAAGCYAGDAAADLERQGIETQACRQQSVRVGCLLFAGGYDSHSAMFVNHDYQPNMRTIVAVKEVVLAHACSEQTSVAEC